MTGPNMGNRRARRSLTTGVTLLGLLLAALAPSSCGPGGDGADENHGGAGAQEPTGDGTAGQGEGGEGDGGGGAVVGSGGSTDHGDGGAASCELQFDCSGVCGGSDIGMLHYADVDRDGLGDPGTAELDCEVPEGRVEQAGDCNDDIFGCQEDCSHCASDGYLAVAVPIVGPEGSAFGASVAEVGDLDGNEVPDVAVGAPTLSTVRILLLDSSAAVLGSFDWVGAPDTGESLAALGDLDGDGYGDLAVGEPGLLVNNTLGFPVEAGQLTVHFLGPTGFGTPVTLASPVPRHVAGYPPISERFASALAPIGDVDGNGTVDLAATQEDVYFNNAEDGGGFSGARPGGVFILLMSETGAVSSFVRIAGPPGGNPWALEAVAPVGDLDDNGVPDLAVLGERLHVVFLQASGEPLFIQEVTGDLFMDELSIHELGFGAQLSSFTPYPGLGTKLTLADPESGDWMSLELDHAGNPTELQSYQEAWLGAPFPPSVPLPGSAWTEIGDIDGDGVHELLVGAPADDTVYIVHPSVDCGPRLIRDCNGTTVDGCETPVDTDEQCGGCERTCVGRPNTTGGSCTAGECELSCASGFVDCNGRPEDGCEMSTNAADYPGAVSVACVEGQVTFVCTPLTGNCDGRAKNGCEYDTSDDLGNCGTCGNVCEPDPARGFVPTCTAGACGDDGTTCSFLYGWGWDACPGQPGSCHCCGGVEPCSSGETCVESQGEYGSVWTCEAPCPVGLGNCDGNPDTGANGCETDLTTRTNCGFCGNLCPVWGWSHFCVEATGSSGGYACKQL